MSSAGQLIDFLVLLTYIVFSIFVISYLKGACAMAEKVSNGKRLDILIVVKDPRLCQGFQSDNEIALASRFNAHSVLFSGFVPFKKLGTISRFSRAFIFDELPEVGHDAYTTNLQKEIANCAGETYLVHSYHAKAAGDFNSLFAKTKNILVKGLTDMYEKLDVQ